jgi:hypothetical protein
MLCFNLFVISSILKKGWEGNMTYTINNGAGEQIFYVVEGYKMNF